MNEFGKVRYWLESAEYDIQTAKAMLETRRFLYVGFMCCQTVEKTLKAVYVSKHPEDELPYIHKLMRLANLSGVTEEMNPEQIQLLNELNPLNIEARYPTQKELLLASLTPERCKAYIQRTEALYEWLKTKC